MKLYEAFEVVRGDVVAFVGAGGKSSTLVGLGYELVDLGWRVLASTTTYIEEEQLALMPYALQYRGDAHAVSRALNEHRFVFLYERIENGRVYAPKLDWTPRLLDSVDSDVLLVEADKADGVAFKVPYGDEPTIPLEASLVVPVVSLAALDKPLDETTVYNPQAMIDKYGFYPNAPIYAPWIGQVLRDEELGLKGVPTKARVVVFLNQTNEEGYMRQRARTIARSALRTPRIAAVAIGNVRAATPIYEVQRAIGAVVLAAGMSTRMGQPKLLLPWLDDKPIIQHIVENLLLARLDYICVVTGAYADQVKRLLKPLDVRLAHNRNYKSGEMLSSLQLGLRTMPKFVNACLVVLGDQPRLEQSVLYHMMKAYSEAGKHIIIPTYQDRRGHPILIGRQYWRDILNLKPPQTLRDALSAHADNTLHVDVGTDSILHDVDTPQDYQQQRLRAGLPSVSFPPKQRD
jgi:molybdenum cofactor cytidylyltransferase